MELAEVKLSILNKRIKAFLEGYRQNIAILGQDKEEINYLLEKYFLKDRKDLFCIRADCSFVSNKEFIKEIAISLLSNLSQDVESLDNLLNSLENHLNLTTSAIKKALKKDTPDFLDVLEIIDNFLRETEKKCILLIQEFTELERLFPFGYQDFAKFVILQKNCMIILSSAQILTAEKILSSELNLLFGNFEKIYLDETIFINNYLYLKSFLSPLSFSPFFLSFFVNILGNNTIYYDLLIPLIKDKHSNNELEDITAVLKESLYKKETYFWQRFSKKIEMLKEQFFKDYSKIFKLLINISTDYSRIRELSSLGLYDLKNLKLKLNKLSELSYLSCHGDIYRIKDPLFSFWLANVFKLENLFLGINPYKRERLWENHIKNEINLFRNKFSKNKIERITELILSFKDDRLCIGKNHYLLPSIEKIKILSCPSKNFSLLIAEGREIIFAGIKENTVMDTDIMEFLGETINIKGKKVKKIFITPGRFSPSARLTAKNHKLIIWGGNELNHLSYIYNKPIFLEEGLTKEDEDIGNL